MYRHQTSTPNIGVIFGCFQSYFWPVLWGVVFFMTGDVITAKGDESYMLHRKRKLILCSSTSNLIFLMLVTFDWGLFSLLKFTLEQLQLDPKYWNHLGQTVDFHYKTPEHTRCSNTSTNIIHLSQNTKNRFRIAVSCKLTYMWTQLNTLKPFAATGNQEPIYNPDANATNGENCNIWQTMNNEMLFVSTWQIILGSIKLCLQLFVVAGATII